jgi:thiol-disulfide isomerase/thioredoxin
MRNILLWVLAILLLVSVAWMANKTIAKVKLKSKIRERVSTLGHLPIHKMDSATYELPNHTGPIVIILFNTTCEHCQYEATELKKSMASFSHVSVLMISSEPIKTIGAFAEQYGLHTEPSVTFAKINPDDVYQTFGSISIPHIFIYGKDRRLIIEFKGETKMEAILKHLP